MSGTSALTHRYRHELLLLPLAVAAVWLLVSWSYLDHISPLYSYAGLTNRPDYGVLAAVPFGIVAVLLGALLPKDTTRPSTIAVWMLYLLLVVPAHAVIPRLASGTTSQHVRTLAVLNLGFLTVVGTLKVLKASFVSVQERAPQSLNKHEYFLAFLVLFGLFNLVILAQLGLRNPLDTASEIYDVRLENRGRLTGPSAYMSIWLSKVLNPLAIVIGFQTSRRWLIGLAVISQVIIFGATGSKALMFATALLFVLIWGVRSGLGLYRSLVGPLGLVTALGALLHAVGSDLLNVLVVRREMMVPSMLTSRYVDYFSTVDYLYWSRSSVSSLIPFLPSSDGPSPARIIGFEIFRNPDSHANANFIASSYANAGVAGVLLMAIAVALLLRVVDSLGDPARSPDRYLATIALLPFLGRSIIQTNLPTALVTHGIILAGLLLVRYPEFSARPAVASDPEPNRSGLHPRFDYISQRGR